MTKHRIQSCLICFAAAVFLAFGIYNVHAVSQITEGGGLGAVLLIQYHFHISPAISGLVLNIICYALGWKTFGKDFLLYSAASALGYSLGYGIFEQFPPLFPGIAQMPLLAAIIGACFVGIGCGFCVRAGGAPSCDDALAMSLSKISGIPIQWVYLTTDILVLSLSLTYIPLARMPYSLVTVILSGQIIGRIQKPHNVKNHKP